MWKETQKEKEKFSMLYDFIQIGKAKKSHIYYGFTESFNFGNRKHK